MIFYVEWPCTSGVPTVGELVCWDWDTGICWKVVKKESGFWAEDRDHYYTRLGIEEIFMPTAYHLRPKIVGYDGKEVLHVIRYSAITQTVIRYLRNGDGVAIGEDGGPRRVTEHRPLTVLLNEALREDDED